MNLAVLTYLVYLGIAVPLTVWVARALHRYGEVFLADVYGGDTNLAHAVNQLLVIGFYLLNLGYVALFMTSHTKVRVGQQVLELLSVKVGAVAIVLGVIHLGNLWAFNAFRRRAVLRARALPPISPNHYTRTEPVPTVPAPPAPGAPQHFGR
ncbi:MAG TPA: hypothetical protein VG435_17280 [Acidimicrobiales bacterium]|jgi:hypothetical protein|nr:hypothetical protein [Acidimicrobiales bacterium]